VEVALRTDVARARGVLRTVLGDVQLFEENGAVVLLLERLFGEERRRSSYGN